MSDRRDCWGRRLPDLMVRQISVPHWERGYDEPTERHYQQLGYWKRGLFGRRFVVLDEEIFPTDIKISLGAFGDTGRDWQSKFMNWIPKKHGGRAENFEHGAIR